MAKDGIKPPFQLTINIFYSYDVRMAPVTFK